MLPEYVTLNQTLHSHPWPRLGQLLPLLSWWPWWKRHKPEQPLTCYFRWRFLFSWENNTAQQTSFQGPQQQPIISLIEKAVGRPRNSYFMRPLLPSIWQSIPYFLLLKCISGLPRWRFSSVQFSSVAQSHPALWQSHGLQHARPPYHQLPEFIQTHVHWVGDAIQLSHPLSSPSPACNLSQHQGLFKWVSSSHQVAKVLEL